MKFYFALGFVLFSTFLSSCSSTPKVSAERVSEAQAKSWFQKYCSKGPRELTGDLVVKSNTREFKGQFPAGIHIDPTGSFKLEVTTILGGTVLRLSSDGSSMSIESPSRPKLNQIRATQYLGLDVPVLTELLLGDLPCPSVKDQLSIKVQGNQMLIQTPLWKWIFEKSDEASGAVPVRVLLSRSDQKGTSIEIELKIENWELAQNYAKKVSVKAPEGTLSWTWRSH